MTSPRLEIDLNKLYHNAHKLVTCLATRGISVTGVTKATLGLPQVAQAFLHAGVRRIGESRVENIEAMRRCGIAAPMVLLRSPMLSQVTRVVASTDLSFNTEVEIIRGLSEAAVRAERTHEIVLMVELGDLREGIMPADLVDVVRYTLQLPNIKLKGIGANLTCRSGVSPDCANMAELSALANTVDATFGPILDLVSGGNSANLRWALSAADTGRINDLRLGESILLGRETLHREPIDGLYTDGVTLLAEVIEVKFKPSKPWGEIVQTALGKLPHAEDRGQIVQAILAIGEQDTDPNGLLPPTWVRILSATSDHLIVELDNDNIRVGSEVAFQLNYSALLRAMTSPFVSTVISGGGELPVYASE
jgi:predicted amino acid racemase